MYSNINFKTKKAFKQATTAGEEITLYQPGPFGVGKVNDGEHCVEGPHYPEPHRWYAKVKVKNGVVVKVT